MVLVGCVMIVVVIWFCVRFFEIFVNWDCSGMRGVWMVFRSRFMISGWNGRGMMRYLLGFLYIFCCYCCCGGGNFCYLMDEVVIFGIIEFWDIYVGF